MSVQTRLLGPGEAQVLAQAAPEVFDDPIDAARTAELLADARHHLAVSVDAGVVVGFASAVHYVHPDKAQPELWINEIGVAPTHRRRGLGKALLRALLERARTLGCTQAWVLTDRGNAAAMELYAAVGANAPSDHIMYEIDLPLDARR